MKSCANKWLWSIFLALFTFQPSHALAQDKQDGTLDADASKVEGCGKDTDCKGDRICENGKCVEPESVSTKAQAPQKPELIKTMVSMGKVKKTGGKGTLDPGEISSVLKYKLSGFKMCYEEAVKKTPSLEGKVKFRFTIKASGEVSTAYASAKGMNDPEFATCLIKKVKALTFPAPKGGSMTFVFPLIFKRVADKDQPAETEKIKVSATIGKVTKLGGKGTLDLASVNKVVKTKIMVLKMCYEMALSKEPDLKGKIVIRFTIGQSGTVTVTTIESDKIKNSTLSSCLIGKLKTFKFPKPEGGDATYIFPFVVNRTD